MAVVVLMFGLALAHLDGGAAPVAGTRQVRELADRLVHELRAQGVTDERVLQLIRETPRHEFVDAPLPRAYENRPQPIGHAQTISQPLIVALMTEALAVSGTERVLEVGTGSGYQAAILSRLARRVYSVERIAPLARAATARLEALGYTNVEVRLGDGYLGWPEAAPFDRIILTAAPPRLPEALVEQLAMGGVLVAPVGEDAAHQRLKRWTRRPHGLTVEDLGPVIFVPMVPGPAAPP